MKKLLLFIAMLLFVGVMRGQTSTIHIYNDFKTSTGSSDNVQTKGTFQMDSANTGWVTRNPGYYTFVVGTQIKFKAIASYENTFKQELQYWYSQSGGTRTAIGSQYQDTITVTITQAMDNKAFVADFFAYFNMRVSVYKNDGSTTDMGDLDWSTSYQGSAEFVNFVSSAWTHKFYTTASNTVVLNVHHPDGYYICKWSDGWTSGGRTVFCTTGVAGTYEFDKSVYLTNWTAPSAQTLSSVGSTHPTLQWTLPTPNTVEHTELYRAYKDYGGEISSYSLISSTSGEYYVDYEVTIWHKTAQSLHPERWYYYYTINYDICGSSSASSNVVEIASTGGGITKTGINKEKSFQLGVYPNPFNPITNVNYSVKRDGNVKIVVANVVGEIIYFAANEYKTAGNYTIPIDLGSKNSGVYFVRVTNGKDIQTYKLLLVK